MRRASPRVIRERNGIIHVAELHWFEAHAVGKVQWKIKR